MPGEVPIAMAQLAVDIQLFISSYALLFVLLGLRFHGLPLRLGCFAIGVVGIVALILIVRGIGHDEPEARRIERVDDRGADVAGYLVTYLLPFLAVAEPSVEDLSAYVLFIVIVGVIYVRSGMIYVNPLLYLFGYRLFSVTTSPDLDAMLIAKQPPVIGRDIWVARVRSHLFVRAAPP